MSAPQSDQRLMRRYFEAAIALTLALVLLPISGLQSRNAVAVGLAIAFAIFAGWLALQLGRVSGSHVVLFGVASLSLALFMLSVAIGPQFGTPSTGNWFFPVVSLVTGLITVCANVALYWKVGRGGA